jgi:hypothetical protein
MYGRVRVNWILKQNRALGRAVERSFTFPHLTNLSQNATAIVMFRNTAAMRRYSSNFRLGVTDVYFTDPINDSGRRYVSWHPFFSGQGKVLCTAVQCCLYRICVKQFHARDLFARNFLSFSSSIFPSFYLN